MGGASTHVVTNTPDVLTRKWPTRARPPALHRAHICRRAERYLRAGKWPIHGDYQLTAVAARPYRRHPRWAHRQADRAPPRAMHVPVVYHTRRPVATVAYSTIRTLVEMARRRRSHSSSSTPGGARPRILVNAEVLDALGGRTAS